MPQVKTAISIRESVFKEIDALAHKTHIPRSRLFEQAVSDFLHKRKGSKLLRQLNAAYDDTADSNEQKQQQLMRVHQHKLMEGQW